MFGNYGYYSHSLLYTLILLLITTFKMLLFEWKLVTLHLGTKNPDCTLLEKDEKHLLLLKILQHQEYNFHDVAGTLLLSSILDTSSLLLEVVEAKFNLVEYSIAYHYWSGIHTKEAFPLTFLTLEFLIDLLQIEFMLNQQVLQ